MKTITIPNPVLLLDNLNNSLLDQDGKPIIITFNNFVSSTLLIDPKFGKTMADILSAVSIKTKLTLNAEKIELENEEWEKLNEVAKEPSSNYNPVIVMQLTSFLLAIKDAK